MCVTCRKNKGKSVPQKEFSGTGCVEKRTELESIHYKLLDIYSISKDPDVLIAIGEVRSWIIYILVHCPDEEDINVLRIFTENEYTKYFPSNL